MSIFNWGIHGGYGLAFPVGRYVPALSTLGWRLPYYAGGAVGLALAVITALTLREPPRRHIGEQQDKDVPCSLWEVLRQPRLVLLCLAASIRHTGELSNLI